MTKEPEEWPAPSERIRSIIRTCNEIAWQTFIGEHKDADEFGYVHLEVTPDEFQEFIKTCPPGFLFRSTRHEFEHLCLFKNVIMKPAQ